MPHASTHELCLRYFRTATPVHHCCSNGFPTCGRVRASPESGGSRPFLPSPQGKETGFPAELYFDLHTLLVEKETLAASLFLFFFEEAGNNE